MAASVIIVASGPSAVDLDLDEIDRARAAGVRVLAVNRAIRWLGPERVDEWFTLDPDHHTLWIMAQPPDRRIHYVAAVPDDYGRPDARVRYHRNTPRFPWVDYLRRVTGAGPYGACWGLAENRGEIHTGNSAYGALGLVYSARAPRIALIGVDADADLGYAHAEGRPRTNFRHLPALFASAMIQLERAGIEVVCGSLQTRLTCFDRVDPNAAVRWAAVAARTASTSAGGDYPTAAGDLRTDGPPPSPGRAV